MPWKEPLTAALEVGVGEDDVRALAAELERHPLQRPPALGADLAADHGRAGEGDLVDAGVVDERGAGLAVAGEHVERPLGEARLERQLAEAQRGERRLLGRLEDDRAAGGERRGDLPDRHQQREVPGHDLGADADRLAQRVDRACRGRRPGSSRPRSSSASRRSSAGGRPRPRRRPSPRRAACRCRATRARRARRRCALISSASVYISPARFAGETLRSGPSSAARAAATARSTSSAPACGDLADRLAGRRVDRLEACARRRPRPARRRSAGGAGPVRRTRGRRRESASAVAVGIA